MDDETTDHGVVGCGWVDGSFVFCLRAAQYRLRWSGCSCDAASCARAESVKSCFALSSQILVDLCHKRKAKGETNVTFARDVCSVPNVTATVCDSWPLSQGVGLQILRGEH